jgi:hypothetical protein
VALRLKRAGFTRIRPLLGGLNLWMSRAFPVDELEPAAGRAPSGRPDGGP